MRFHTSAVIQCSDPARVSSVLKEMLLDLTIDVVCAGQRMTLVGFGPGDVSMNQVDTTVLTFEERSDGLFVEADGIFDGSHLAEPAGQEEQVRSKLDRVFVAVQELIERQETGGRTARVGRRDTEAVPIRPEESPEGATAPPGPVWSSSGKEPRLIYAAVLDTARANRVPDFAPANRWRFGILEVAALGIAVMTVGFAAKHELTRRYSSNSQFAQTRTGVGQQVQPKFGATASTDVIRTEASTSNAVTSPIPFAASSRFSDASSDPIIWLSHWERAMRTRDAAKQSSFYADRVDRYEGEKRLSNADVKELEQTAIAKRKGLWVVKMEGVSIQKRSRDAVELQLIKHVIYQPAFEHTSEEFVKTELKLKRLNSEWKIVSEEDLEKSPNPLA